MVTSFVNISASAPCAGEVTTGIPHTHQGDWFVQHPFFGIGATLDKDRVTGICGIHFL